MNNKTFGMVVGITVSLALAMFIGLYMLGLSGNSASSKTFDDGYGYLSQTDDDGYYYEDYVAPIDTPSYSDKSFYITDTPQDYIVESYDIQE